MLIRSAGAVFQDDKKVYCAQHSFRAIDEVNHYFSSSSLQNVNSSSSCFSSCWTIETSNSQNLLEVSYCEGNIKHMYRGSAKYEHVN